MSWHLITCEDPRTSAASAITRRSWRRVSRPPAMRCTSIAPGRSGRRRARCTVHPCSARFPPPTCGGPVGTRCLPGAAAPVVQWVPHGFGQRSLNLGFCLWVARRARAGDLVDVVVHEPYLEFGWGPLRHLTMAVVHRLMTAVLLRAADRVWISTPAWESRLRPYALGRASRCGGCRCPAARPPRAAPAAPHRSSPAGRPLVGHFGTYGEAVATLLEERLAGVMAGPSRPALLLLGAGGEPSPRGCWPGIPSGVTACTPPATCLRF